MPRGDITKIGRKFGHGRKKGTPNKITVSVRDAIKQAFDEEGGVQFLRRLSKKEPRTFAYLLQKLVPQAIQHEISGPGGGPIQYVPIITGIPDAPAAPPAPPAPPAEGPNSG
jgi:hypothetical protein